MKEENLKNEELTENLINSDETAVDEVTAQQPTETDSEPVHELADEEVSAILDDENQVEGLQPKAAEENSDSGNESDEIPVVNSELNAEAAALVDDIVANENKSGVEQTTELVAENALLTPPDATADDEEAPDEEESEEDDEINTDRITEATFIKEEDDVTEFTKKDLLDLAGKLVDAIKKSNINVSDVKNIDNVAKQIQVVFDEIITAEKTAAFEEYKKENNAEEGFEFKNDNITLRFEAAMADIRDTRNKIYKKLRQLKDDYFEVKTALLERLRLVVEEEEKGGSKENWNAFKKVQEEWRDAGNIGSPHNGSLWSAYNALTDRYFSIRSIQNELKDLDRKKNLESKSELANKITALADEIGKEGYSSTLFKQANELFEEYKALGPAPREEQEALWVKVKAAFDAIYDKKREQSEANQQLRLEVLEVKTRLVESLRPYISFDSTSINEWNNQTKEVLAIQEQWNEIKGSMPREAGKTITKEFWVLVKQFFKNKSDFFDKLEDERKQNLAKKTAICEEIEQMLAAKTTDAPETNRVVELQKVWRTIGHVPKKQQDSIYKRFKKAADAFFDLKRAENAEQDNEYESNLKAKQAICDEVEKLTETGEIDLRLLSDFKNRFNSIGFVPRKHIKTIQSRFINAINAFVKASSSISSKEEEKLLIKNQVEVELKSGSGSKTLGKQENDLKRKAKTLEDDIALWRNNIEFFGPSKGAEKMKAEFEKKIVKAENELTALNEKIKLLSVALES